MSERSARRRMRRLSQELSAANLPRVWDRFFTTRGDRGGTGLGLPIVASVIAAHGGTVSVTCSAEAGTVCACELPVG